MEFLVKRCERPRVWSLWSGSAALGQSTAGSWEHGGSQRRWSLGRFIDRLTDRPSDPLSGDAFFWVPTTVTYANHSTICVGSHGHMASSCELLQLFFSLHWCPSLDCSPKHRRPKACTAQGACSYLYITVHYCWKIWYSFSMLKTMKSTSCVACVPGDGLQPRHHFWDHTVHPGSTIRQLLREPPFWQVACSVLGEKWEDVEMHSKSLATSYEHHQKRRLWSKLSPTSNELFLCIWGSLMCLWPPNGSHWGIRSVEIVTGLHQGITFGRLLPPPLSMLAWTSPCNVHYLWGLLSYII